MSSLAQAAVTKDHGGGLKQQTFISQEVQGRSVSRAGVSRDLCLLCPHVAFPPCTGIPGVPLCVRIPSSLNDTSPAGLGPTLLTSLNLTTSLKVLPPNQSHAEVLRVWAST